jgi:hypothetical protein
MSYWTYLRAEIDNRMDIPPSFDIETFKQVYRKGGEAGKAEEKHFWVEYMLPYVHEIQGLLFHSGYAFGVASAGAGNIPHKMLKDTSKQITAWVKGVKLEHERVVEYHRANYGIVLPFDIDDALSQSYIIEQALDAMYTGKDPAGNLLREVAGLYGGILIKENIKQRPALLPGAKSDNGVTWIADESRALARVLEIDLNTRKNQILIGQRLYEQLYRKREYLEGLNPDDEANKGILSAWEKLAGCIPKRQFEPDKNRLRDLVYNALKQRPIG